MKKYSDRRTARAFTLVELLVVVVIVFVLVAMMIPIKDGSPEKAVTPRCMSNLRQTEIGFIMWADDHSLQFPWQVSNTNGGTMEFIAGGQAYRHFQVLSDFPEEPQVFLCPSDKARHAATNLAQLRDTNLSYFVSLDATMTNHPALAILAGDRHLQANGQPAKPGLFAPSAGSTMGWTRELHDLDGKTALGNLVFADGHAETTRAERLTDVFQRQGFTPSRLAIP